MAQAILKAIFDQNIKQTPHDEVVKKNAIDTVHKLLVRHPDFLGTKNKPILEHHIKVKVAFLIILESENVNLEFLKFLLTPKDQLKLFFAKNPQKALQFEKELNEFIKKYTEKLAKEYKTAKPERKAAIKKELKEFMLDLEKCSFIKLNKNFTLDALIDKQLGLLSENEKKLKQTREEEETKIAVADTQVFGVSQSSPRPNLTSATVSATNNPKGRTVSNIRAGEEGTAIYMTTVYSENAKSMITTTDEIKKEDDLIMSKSNRDEKETSFAAKSIIDTPQEVEKETEEKVHKFRTPFPPKPQFPGSNG